MYVLIVYKFNDDNGRNPGPDRRMLPEGRVIAACGAVVCRPTIGNQ